MAQRQYSEYISKLQDEFPDVDLDSLKDVVEHGLNKMYSYISKSHDVFIKMDNSVDPFFLYIGYNDTSNIEQIKRSKKEEHYKLRRLFKESKKTSDFFYFGLTDEEFNEFIRNGTIPRIAAYKILEESYIRSGVNHIFRTKLEPDEYKHWIRIKENYKKDLSEYILVRQDSKFKTVTNETK